MIKFLQLIILLFIARRFLKIYFTLDKKNSSTRFYNHFFCALVFINVFLMVTLGVFMILEIFFEDEAFVDKEGNSYILFSYSIFSFLSSLTLFLIGLHLKNMIKDSLKDSYEKDDLNYYFETKRSSLKKRSSIQGINKETESNKNLDVPILDENILVATNQDQFLKHQDEYFTKRVKQINLVTISFLICDIYQLLYSLLKIFIIPNHFENSVLTIIPLTKLAAILFFLNNLTFLVPILTNYLAFYFLIRHSYKTLKFDSTKFENIDYRDLFSYSDRLSSNHDIENYLGSN